MRPVHSDAGPLREFLANRDLPCPACCSNLRGLIADTCPECGAPLHLSVSTTGPRLGPWLVVLLAVTIPLGFTAVLATLALVAEWRTATRGAVNLGDLVFLGAATVGLAGALWFVVRRRGRFLARPRFDQYARALAAAIFFAATTAGVLFVWVRL